MSGAKRRHEANEAVVEITVRCARRPRPTPWAPQSPAATARLQAPIAIRAAGQAVWNRERHRRLRWLRQHQPRRSPDRAAARTSGSHQAQPRFYRPGFLVRGRGHAGGHCREWTSPQMRVE